MEERGMMIIIPKWLFALFILIALPYAILLMSMAASGLLMFVGWLGDLLGLWNGYRTDTMATGAEDGDK